MIHLQRTLVIDARPDAVWDVIGRFMHINEFAPLVKSVDAMTDGEDRVGSKRRCHFEDGSSLVEEVTEWEANRGYCVQLSDTASTPLKEAHAELSIKLQGSDRTLVIWSLDYRMKYGPFGWLLGQTIMKMVMGKILNGNLKGLADKIRSIQATAAQTS